MAEAASLDETRLREVFRALHEHAVEYAVCGAVALGLHGLARATGDVDLFIRPQAENIERLKAALRSVFDDPSIDEISAEELCGGYPAVRYLPPDGFGFNLVTRLGEVVSYAELEIEVKMYDDVPVRVVTPRLSGKGRRIPFARWIAWTPCSPNASAWSVTRCPSLVTGR
jgi:hypothetical protein